MTMHASAAGLALFIGALGFVVLFTFGSWTGSGTIGVAAAVVFYAYGGVYLARNYPASRWYGGALLSIPVWFGFAFLADPGQLEGFFPALVGCLISSYVGTVLGLWMLRRKLALGTNALTASPGLHDFPSFDANEYLRDITPLVPGLLVEAVPDAGPGGVNRLISPIDNLPIATDVLGNQRRYTSNNTRNIGAVQNADAPVLKAIGGNAKVDLSWNKPAGTKTGYEICASTSAILPDPFIGICPGTISSVSDPTKTAQTIASLINGSPY